MSQRKVREIRNPSFPDMYKHVGVYCRVSTGSMPQLHSLAEQVSHYVQMLRARPPYIGSSLSKADEPYFDMIERTTFAHWTFYYYNDDSAFKKFVESHRIAADRFSMVSDKEIKL